MNEGQAGMIWHARRGKGKGSDQGDDRGETHGKREDTRKREKVTGYNGRGGTHHLWWDDVEGSGTDVGG
jgi:hypothetical protein